MSRVARSQQVRGAVSHPVDPSSEAGVLRRKVLDTLREQGFELNADYALSIPALDKNRVRQLHAQARQARIERAREGLKRHETRLLTNFARGDEVDPAHIQPRLTRVEPGSVTSG